MSTQAQIETIEARTDWLERSARRWRGVAIGLVGLAVGGVLMAQQYVGAGEVSRAETEATLPVRLVGVTNLGPGHDGCGVVLRLWSDGATEIFQWGGATSFDFDTEAYFSGNDSFSHNARNGWRPHIDAPIPSP